ncbi:hypothetical protein ACFQ2T_04870 [Methylophilus flavus]|uniref:Zinc ribbon domain-containing protein n=1 Tax=Methylophilus flavus TaxID=640084 RepID=A0ABW3PCE5_9PROT
MENNYCPHCGKSMKEEDGSKEAMIDELIESFKAEGESKESDKKQPAKKASK